MVAMTVPAVAVVPAVAPVAVVQAAGAGLDMGQAVQEAEHMFVVVASAEFLVAVELDNGAEVGIASVVVVVVVEERSDAGIAAAAAADTHVPNALVGPAEINALWD